jgi:hypothetical protein
MKCPLRVLFGITAGLLAVLCVSPLSAAPKPAPTPPAPTVADPAELTTLRMAYEAKLTPLNEKLNEAIKKRAERYAADLDKIAGEAAGAGKTDTLEPLKKERDAYISGLYSSGFDPENKKVPPGARDLRRAYDQDAAKIRLEAAATARPAASDYLRQLTDLENAMMKSKNADGLLAVRAEKKAITQAAQFDPLYGGDVVMAGHWANSEGVKTSFRANGTVMDGNGVSGNWTWEDRGRRKISIDWNGNRKNYSYTLTPDGGGMVGLAATPKHERISLDREAGK